MEGTGTVSFKLDPIHHNLITTDDPFTSSRIQSNVIQMAAVFTSMDFCNLLC